MGLLSWLFPTPEDRIRKAEAHLGRNRPELARLELLDLAESREDARAVLHRAENQLAVRNLDAAIQYSRLHEDEKAADCLALAETFHHGGLEERFQETRREMREIRTDRSEAEERRRAEQQARLLQVDPLGFSGPGFLDAGASTEIEADREEIEQRLALLVEQYPESLRTGVRTLGADFARAVLALDDGKPDVALPELMALPDQEPLVCWERARAAHALGDPKAAAESLAAFARYAGQHHPIGANHTGVYLAQMLAEAGDRAGALRVLRDVRSGSSGLGGFLFAQLLFLDGELPESERVLVGMIKEHPKEAALYALLARVRVAGGHRMEAMRALEASMEAICCTPGKCGSKQPDLDTHRLLATLYLEDDVETVRGIELAGIAATLVQRPTWEDAYLAALAAKARHEPEAAQLVRRLAAMTPEGHPGAERLGRLLGASPG